MCCPANSTVTYRADQMKFQVNVTDRHLSCSWHCNLYYCSSEIGTKKHKTHLVHACDFRDVDDRVGAVLIIVCCHFSLEEKKNEILISQMKQNEDKAPGKRQR